MKRFLKLMSVFGILLILLEMTNVNAQTAQEHEGEGLIEEQVESNLEDIKPSSQNEFMNLLENRVDLWTDQVCLSYFSWLRWWCHTFDINIETDRIKEWMRLSPEERQARRDQNRSPRNLLSQPSDPRFIAYLSILDEIDRRDALSLEGQLILQIETSPWRFLPIEERAEQWAIFARDKSLDNRGFFKPFSKDEITLNRRSLLRWGGLSPYERDLERVYIYVHNQSALGPLRSRRRRIHNRMNDTKSFYNKDMQAAVYAFHFSMYHGERYLRAIVNSIDAMDALSRDMRNNERLQTWSSLTFEERNRWRKGKHKEDHLEYQLFLLIEGQADHPSHIEHISELLGVDFVRRTLEIMSEDQQLRDRLTMDAINQWLSLERVQREELRQAEQGIRDQIDVPFLGNEIERIVNDVEKADLQNRFEELKTRIENYLLMSFDERNHLRFSGSGRDASEEDPSHEQLDNYLSQYLRRGRILWFPEYQNIQDMAEVRRLDDWLNDMLADLEIKDNQFRDELINHQIRQARGLEMYEAETPEVSDLLEGYSQLKVKLFPINTVSCAVYQRTLRNDMQALSLRSGGGGLRIEVYDSDLKSLLLLSERAESIEVDLSEPYVLGHNNNRFQFDLPSGRREVYSLSRLINFEEGQFIKITPLSDLNPVRVRWGLDERRVNKTFWGSFRIQVAQVRGDHRREWSLINEVAMEQYLQSVIPAEMSPSSHIEAIKAQVVAAGTFALYHALDANILQREWDVDPTTAFQTYNGSESEHERSNMAIAETIGNVLIHSGQIIESEYHACVRLTTNDVPSNPGLTSRNIPSRIACNEYEYGGHGRGMNQVAAMILASDGWSSRNRNEPSEDARIPENIREPWTYIDILEYFYEADVENILAP